MKGGKEEGKQEKERRKDGKSRWLPYPRLNIIGTIYTLPKSLRMRPRVLFKKVDITIDELFY